MDRRKMTDGIRTFLEGLDQRFEGDDQEKTPQRVASACIDDLVAGYVTDPDQELSWTSAPGGCGPVLVRRIDFASVCVHHLLPFFGQAYLAYVPAERLAGMSKIGRVVEAHARRLQTQERLTLPVVEPTAPGHVAELVAPGHLGREGAVERGVRAEMLHEVEREEVARDLDGAPE